MAGGSRWFSYGSDIGVVYAISRDTSNTTAVNGAGNTYTGSVRLDTIPKFLRPRFAVYSDFNGRRNIRVTILSPAIYIALLKGTSGQTLTDPLDGTTVMNLAYVRPEVTSRLPRPNDTGLVGLGPGA